jgi:flagellin-like hook-associated protein FlgL
MSARIGSSYIDSVIYRHWTSVSQNVSKRIERLSSGLRINTAADDASGIGISEKLRALASGLQVSIGNLQDGLSVIQTAQGSLDRVSLMLRRVRDLTELAANGDKSDADREYYQTEIDQILQEVDKIGKVSQYNTKNLLNGNLGKTAQLAGDKDGVVEGVNYEANGTQIIRGEYKFEVEEAATHARALITGAGRDSDSGDAAFTLNDKFLDFVGGTKGTYAFNIQADGKNVAIELKADESTTIGDVVTQINSQFQNQGVKLSASFEADVNSSAGGVVGDNDILAALKIESTEVGSAHDIRISVINQPGNVFSVNPAASEGTQFNIYNSDLSGQNGRISENTVLQSGDNTDDLNSLELMSDYENAAGEVVLNGALTIRDGAGNTKTLDIDTTGNNKFTIKDVVDAINSQVSGSTYGGITANINGSGFNVKAVYNETEGKIELLDQSGVKTSSLKVSGVLAERLGIKGESQYSYAITGTRLTSTRDYKLKITDPNNFQTEVLGKYTGGSSTFEFTGDSLVSSGYETAAGEFAAGGVPGLEIDLSNKKLQGGEKFSVLLSGDDLTLMINPEGKKYDFELPEFTTKSLGIEGINVRTQENAFDLLDKGTLDKALDKVVKMETKLGGISSGLEHEIHRLRIEYENITAGESRIRDTDVGYEMMKLTKEQIIQQSGSKMLSFEKMDRSIIKALLQTL